ncbi:MAG TPA: thiamine diphosphokinase [Bacteroidales bacterium]|nr:thiamine diphosphokinase [Bacteroidales bacterium]HPF04139.1 thiamine diphosphokinase [Bacteroidales bacterium]HPJ60684.1 thiamine diphosphokinase [Bacteroidales bacterium]HPR12670.1 thiamine diphosphokinase [Bacteroidales bacterium]HRW84649.1 thiamine diphosphokinase [Bacteroidales bacterium]
MEEVIKKSVIVADGTFPSHPAPLNYLREAEHIVCCDGSAEKLIEAGILPDAIIGDMDSLSRETAEKFAGRIFRDESQETNDLTKAVEWCKKSGFKDITILGATGRREDHSIGNISLLAEYSKFVRIRMITDNGIFLPFHDSCRIETFPGQQISVFSINPETEITSKGLKFPLVRRKLKNWWEATLNEATGNSVELEFRGSPLLVFLAF